VAEPPFRTQTNRNRHWGRGSLQVAATGVDELLAATLHYADGGVAQLVCGLTGVFDNALVIGGERGFIRVASPFIHGREAVLHSDGTTETIVQPHRGEGFEYQIEEAMRCFRQGEIEIRLGIDGDARAGRGHQAARRRH